MTKFYIRVETGKIWQNFIYKVALFIHVLHLCGHWPNFGDTVFDKIVLFNSVTHAILNIILDPGQSLQQSTNKSVVFNPVLYSTYISVEAGQILK